MKRFFPATNWRPSMKSLVYMHLLFCPTIFGFEFLMYLTTDPTTWFGLTWRLSVQISAWRNTFYTPMQLMLTSQEVLSMHNVHFQTVPLLTDTSPKGHNQHLEDSSRSQGQRRKLIQSLLSTLFTNEREMHSPEGQGAQSGTVWKIIQNMLFKRIGKHTPQ